MATVTRYPTTDAAVSGTWTTPTNVQADDAATASVAPGAKNTSNEREQAGYGFDAQIPSNATIDNVFLEAGWHVVSPGVSFLGVQYLISGAGGTYQENSAEPTANVDDVFDVTALRAWTRADLLDGTFATRLRARNGNSASGTYHYDFVRVRVVYTIPPPSISSASASDSGRDWTAPHQDISITFDREMQGAPAVDATIPGLTMQINGGANNAVTYRSGSGTATWVVRAAQLCRNGQTLVLDYDPATGAIVSVADGQEMSTQTDKAVTNNLTKRIRRTLKDSAGNLITTLCSFVLFPAAGRDHNQVDWMITDRAFLDTPNASGEIDAQYTGIEEVGTEKLYMVVFNPPEGAGDPIPTQAVRTAIWVQDVD